MAAGIESGSVGVCWGMRWILVVLAVAACSGNKERKPAPAGAGAHDAGAAPKPPPADAPDAAQATPATRTVPDVEIPTPVLDEPAN